ncbi:MAG: hypothetical protein IJV40_04080 [Oscillospiraceae bacterium]|nr:hypothetical protein [Oscillospiraceae bacterium]
MGGIIKFEETGATMPVMGCVAADTQSALHKGKDSIRTPADEQEIRTSAEIALTVERGMSSIHTPGGELDTRTPIEIALAIDKDGKTTAKLLYAWLGLDPGNYTRWVRMNILENPFAEEGVEYSSCMRKIVLVGIRGPNTQISRRPEV